MSAPGWSTRECNPLPSIRHPKPRWYKRLGADRQRHQIICSRRSRLTVRYRINFLRFCKSNLSPHSRNMKVIMVTLLLAAVALSAAEAGAYYHAAPAIVPAPAYYAAPAPALVRTPSLDSAVVHSERVGGNFAYSSVEGHAYTALSPVVHPAPVAIAYKAQPLVAPYPVVHAASYPAVYAPAKSFYYAH